MPEYVLRKRRINSRNLKKKIFASETLNTFSAHDTATHGLQEIQNSPTPTVQLEVRPTEVRDNTFPVSSQHSNATSGDRSSLDLGQFGTDCLVTDWDIPNQREEFEIFDSLHVFGQNDGKSLRQLLVKDTFGEHLIQKSDKGEALNSTDRAILVKLIVECELKSLSQLNNTIRKYIWQQWAKEITLVFKGEIAELYYIPYHVVDGKVVQASGLFHNRLITHRRTLTGSKKKSTSGSSCGESDNKSPKRIRPLPESFSACSDVESAEECLDWLKGSSSPPSMVNEKWHITFTLRNNFLKTTTYKEYFETFPALTLPKGYKLLSADFDTVYSNASLVYHEKFPVIKTKILQLLADKGNSTKVDQSVQDLLSLASVGEEHANLAAFLSIPILLRHMTTISIPRKKVWKLSREEVRRSFIGHVVSAADIERHCFDREQLIATRGIPEQPYILAVGPSLASVTQYEVIVNKNIRYQLPDIQSAIKHAYHLYWALDCAYPKDCAQCWMFVQRTMFKMTSKFDTEGVPLRELLHKFN